MASRGLAGRWMIGGSDLQQVRLGLDETKTKTKIFGYFRGSLIKASRRRASTALQISCRAVEHPYPYYISHARRAHTSASAIYHCWALPSSRLFMTFLLFLSLAIDTTNYRVWTAVNYSPSVHRDRCYTFLWLFVLLRTAYYLVNVTP